MVHVIASWVLIYISACSWLVAAIAEPLPTCAEGQQRGKECRAQLASSDSRATGLAAEDSILGKDPALAFIQTTLSYKKRELSLGEVIIRPANPSAKVAEQQPLSIGQDANVAEQQPLLIGQAIAVVNRTEFRHNILPCLQVKELEGTIPLTVSAQAKVMVFEAVGLTSAFKLCEPHKLELGLVSYVDQAIGDSDVLSSNRKAKILIIIWSVFCLGAILWSVWAVLVVPRKKTWENGKQRYLNLGDEHSAFKRGFFSWVTLGWADDLVGRYGKCWSSTVDANEFVPDASALDVGASVDKFKEFWAQECRRVGIQNASIFKVCLKVVGWKSLLAMALSSLFEISMQAIGMVVALDMFLQYIEQIHAHMQLHPGEPTAMLQPTIVAIALVWGVPMLYRLSSVTVTLLDGHYCNLCSMSIACVVFEKALDSPAGQEPTNTDQEGVSEDNTRPDIVQILNVDIIETWMCFYKVIFQTMYAPLISIVLFIMLVSKIHAAGAIGFLYLIPTFMLSACVFKETLIQWARYQGFQDTRMRSLRETMVHIRTIKALAWERLMYRKMHDTRVSELSCMQKSAICQGMLQAVTHTIPFGTMLFSMWYLLCRHGNVKVYEIVMTFRIIMSMLEQVSSTATGMNKLVQAPNSFRRIGRFLASCERPQNVIRPQSSNNPGTPALRVRGSFSWIRGSSPVLKDLDMAVPRGDLVAVVGSIASGKSALCQAILGELFPSSEAYVEGPQLGLNNVAYCSQIPWINEGTLRHNILLGQALDSERYYKCLHSAALTPDLQILPGGDQVCIGSFGIRLSGGQRARVALARAAYSKANLVIIDDPFASVDVPTGEHIFEELLMGPIMEGRTRIVVMQPSPARLQKFDRVLLLEDGAVVAAGAPADVMSTAAFKSLQAVAGMADTSSDTEEGGFCAGDRSVMVWQQEKHVDEEVGQLREMEVADYITFDTLLWWVWSGGYSNIIVFVALMLLTHVLVLQEALVVSDWINAKMMGNALNDSVYLVRLLLIVLTTAVIIMFGAYLASRVAVSAATTIHKDVVQRILRAPIDRFFDKQPVGRLVNRLSHDLRQVDDAVNTVIVGLFGFCTGMIVVQVWIFLRLPWWMALFSLPVFGIIFWFIYLFRGVSVPLAFFIKFRLSDVHDLQGVVLTSCVSIRANGMSKEFARAYMNQAALVIRASYLSMHVCKAWVQCRVFLCYGTLSTFFAIAGLWSHMPLGTLNLVINLCFQQMGDFENACTMVSNLINVLNSVQRLTRFTTIPQEAPEDMPSDPKVRVRLLLTSRDLGSLELQRPGLANNGDAVSSVTVCQAGKFPILRASLVGSALELFPGRKLRDLAPASEELRDLGDESYAIVGVNNVCGDAVLMAQELCSPQASIWLDLWCSRYAEGMRITLEDLCAGYGTDKNVLSKLNFDIAPKTKVGIAGSTGCGKSTTMLCLLRVLEPRGGRILLSGLDTQKMGLVSLRSMIGLVPQDPTVFAGTWRTNIDPFSEFPDGCIWEAFRHTQLLSLLRTFPMGLESPIASDGGNLSIGQRQLLSLARMVIRQPPILLLDECTSALDPASQQAVQSTLLNAFPFSTVVAIAHRVETILEFDRIVVLDKGAVAENGTVKEVMQMDGIFAGMVKKSQKP